MMLPEHSYNRNNNMNLKLLELFKVLKLLTINASQYNCGNFEFHLTFCHSASETMQ